MKHSSRQFGDKFLAFGRQVKNLGANVLGAILHPVKSQERCAEGKQNVFPYLQYLTFL